MKPAWDKLMKEYEGNDGAGVFDVDCTAEGKPLCDSHGVRGFPTIKYGDPSDLQDYNGGRDFDSLQKFAQENLVPSCSPANIDLCDEEKTAEIEKFSAMSDDDLDKFITEKEELIADAEKTFKDEVGKLQKKYESLMEAKESTTEEVTNSGLGLAKSVKAFKAKNAKDEL